MSDLLTWLENWFVKHCNDDWEHSYGLKIETLDNPGWSVEIDLERTPWEYAPFERIAQKKSKTDWMICEKRDGQFLGHGDPLKLTAILATFKTFVEKRPPSR